jgi:hypothetical protein
MVASILFFINSGTHERLQEQGAAPGGTRCECSQLINAHPVVHVPVERPHEWHTCLLEVLSKAARMRNQGLKAVEIPCVSFTTDAMHQLLSLCT